MGVGDYNPLDPFSKDWTPPNPNEGGASMGSYDPSTGTYKFDNGGSGGSVPLPFMSNSAAAPTATNASNSGGFLNWLKGAAGGTTSGASAAGSTTGSLLDYIRLGLGIYQATKKPKFANQPLSPQEQQLFDIYIKNLTNPATKDNAANVNKASQQIMNSYSNLSWNAPKTHDGQTGYPGNAAQVQQQQQAPQPPPQAPIPRTGGIGGGVGQGGRLIQNRDFVGDKTIPFPTAFGSAMTPANNATLDPKNASLYTPPGSTNPSMFAGSQLPPGMSYGDSGLLGSIVSTYGKAALEGVLAIMTQNPILGVKAAFDLWKSNQNRSKP